MKKARILIVEDEAIIAMEIESQLQSLGYQVTSIVDTGEISIQKAEEDKPDLILMDIRIKGEMDGIDAAEEIRNRFGIPVVFSTAYLDKERIERAKITMPFGYVLKPVRERDLKVTIEMALYVAKVDVERRKTELALTKSEEFLNKTGEMARVGGWEVNLEKNTVYWSAVTKLIHEVPFDYEPTLNEATDFFPGESWQLVTDAVNKAIEFGESYELELEFETAKKNRIIVRTIGHSSFENGKCVRLYGTFQDITERKRVVESLKKSEEWFSTTLRSIGDAVIATDTKGNVTLLNPVAESLTGWKQEEAEGKPLKEVFNIVNETTRELVENPVEKVLTTGNIIGLANHTILIAKDGKEIPIDDSGSPIKNENGEIIGVVLVFRDITEQKQAKEVLPKTHDVLEQRVEQRTRELAKVNEELRLDVDKRKHLEEKLQKHQDYLEELVEKRTHELKKTNEQLTKEVTERKQAEKASRESEEKYRNLAENPFVGIFRTAIENGVFIYSNQKNAEIIGYDSPRDLIGKIGAADFCSSEARIQLLDVLKREGKVEDYEVILTLEDGTQKDVSVSAKLWPEEGYLEGVIVDVSKRKQTEEKVKKSQILLKSSTENTNIPILSVDKQYRYLYFNSTHKDAMVSAYNKNIEIGMNLLDCISNEEDRKKSKINFDHAFSGKNHVTIEEYGDFERLYYETRYIPIHNGNNDVIGAAAFIEDISSRKQAEEQIQTSLKEKETLLQEIHHRVMNNMQVISSLLKLQGNSVENDQIKDIIKASQSRIYAMSAVHETLHESENLSEIDLKNYLSKITTSVFQSSSVDPRKIKLNSNIEKMPIGIQQASPLGLVINELISNSLKYAFPDERKGEITVNLKKLDKELELTIKDDGVGIPKGFDWKTYSTLGLKLVRTLVETQLDGSIDMESKNGTKFTIKFNIET